MYVYIYICVHIIISVFLHRSTPRGFSKFLPSPSPWPLWKIPEHDGRTIHLTSTIDGSTWLDMARHGSTWLDPSSFIKSCYLNHLCQIGPRCFMIFPHFSWDFSHFFQISVPDWRARRCLLCRLHLRWSRPREKMETDMPKTSHEKSEMTRKSSMTFT